MMSTFTHVKNEKILGRISHLLSQCKKRKLRDLPEPPSPLLTLDEFGDALFSKGLSYDVVERVKVTIRKQRQLLDWYGQRDLTEDGHPELAPDRPTEHEVVAHVIVPLLLALGWSEQLLAVEWRKMDLAAFWGTPTDGAHCKLICEAKVMRHGLQNVLGQAIRYAGKVGLDKCDKILLADGGRFYLFRKKRGRWEDQPSGYLNVKKLRQRHLCPPNTSAVDTLIALTPGNVAR